MINYCSLLSTFACGLKLNFLGSKQINSDWYYRWRHGVLVTNSALMLENRILSDVCCFDVNVCKNNFIALFRYQNKNSEVNIQITVFHHRSRDQRYNSSSVALKIAVSPDVEHTFVDILIFASEREILAERRICFMCKFYLFVESKAWYWVF